ncbi:MAG: transglycosylase SLT domain-containing protein [Myxococcales bacterium]|nr:transglycosylase SLT domain-containing protein [Myxococcales bacterium]MCB9530958.1 transglycosylase SLT domain-containing protein [Myxococcales bacterium]MCB9532878.1 transglycosylase SLT domain-containing protein [Myxococcales bacterium]
MKNALATAPGGAPLAAMLALLWWGCAAAADAQPAGARVLARDAAVGGPAVVSLAELGPMFEGDVAAALEELDRGRTALAIEELASIDGLDESHADAAAFAYAYALHLSGDHAAALPALRACADRSELFADYCAYWGSLSALELGDAAVAEALAARVDEGSVFGPRARFVAGRALASGGHTDEAIVALERFLVAYPSAWYRDDVEFELAAAYRVSGRTDDAIAVYRRVALVNPGGADEARAERELAALGVRDVAAARTTSDTLERAQILFDRHRSDQVIELLEPVVRSSEAGSDVYCGAAYLVGKSYTKLRRHADSLPPYRRVIDDCADEDLRVKALYNAGRAAWNVDADDDAIAYFRQLWTEYPSSSYADDAMLLAARVRLTADPGAAGGFLSDQVARYPDGDMLGEAVWLMAQQRWNAGDFRGVVRFVDEQASRTGESDLYSRGRLAYFRGRALERLSLGREARSAYSGVVRDNPMTYYALLALNRLAELDASAADALVAELGAAGSGSGRIEIRPAEVARDPSFRRGATLLRMGLYGLAEPEFEKVEAAYPNEEEVDWVVSLMYHRAGAFERSYRVQGGRDELRLAYPTGENRERWEIAYPAPFGDLVSAAATERDIDPYWVYAIMRSESGFRPEIESWANARGLLQLMEGTANDMARLTGRGSVRASQLFDPAINIELGSMFIRTLADRFARHPCLVFGGYNGGQGNVNSWLRARGTLPLDEWVEAIPYDQTRNYVKGVTTNYWVYSWLYADRRVVRLPFDLSDI